MTLCRHTELMFALVPLNFWLHANYTLEMWCMNAKLATHIPTSPVKTFLDVFHRCLEWEERQHAFRIDQILGESVTGGWIHDYQMVTFKQSYLLAGITFFDTINICDSAHTITHKCKSRYFIPKYDIIWIIYLQIHRHWALLRLCQ